MQDSQKQAKLEATLYAAIKAAIDEVGPATFFATSLFASNESKMARKAA